MVIIKGWVLSFIADENSTLAIFLHEKNTTEIIIQGKKSKDVTDNLLRRAIIKNYASELENLISYYQQSIQQNTSKNSKSQSNEDKQEQITKYNTIVHRLEEAFWQSLVEFFPKEGQAGFQHSIEEELNIESYRIRGDKI